MGEKWRKLDMEELMNYSNNLIQVLKEEKDAFVLNHFLRHTESSQSHWPKHHNQVATSIQDYKRKINACKQEAAVTESDTVADAVLDSLQKVLDEEHQLERKHREDIRVITNGVDDLDRRRVYTEEEFQKIKKVDQNELRAQMKLSMYASVTNTIPDLEDDESKLSGHIVVRDKRAVDKFELDPSKDNCNTIWKMIKPVKNQSLDSAF
ncbi:hypothetical protein ABFS82_04G143500 [Erythranthe guttata]|nr:PREDICTED: uncharacterized protein LOC105973578 [Erythranthe guttata]|eukprot:XP_012854066.1 PREDICTED: uncharacterized protein LOC105973578 [Erythranthe guttata]